jgi:photosystem II stability/assembly factor-like uncharacterized protein
MKNTFRNTVAHNKLSGLRTKKKVTSLLMLIAVGVALFATPTVSFARSHLSNGSDQSHTTSVTTIHSNTQPKPLIAIRMLDTMHGWALTGTSVLKTPDGGLHWTDVTPPNSPVHPEVATFMNQTIAWVAGVTHRITGQWLVTVQHTSDGGAHWQNVQFAAGYSEISGITSPPRFINTQEGWLSVLRDYNVGAGRTESDLFHTTDGGNHWSIAATAEQIYKNDSIPGFDTGVSVENAKNIYVTLGPNEALVKPTFPIVIVTHDGGKTWQQQQLSPISGLAANTIYRTAPPVFFGNYGLMPIEFGPTASSSKVVSGLSIYMTNDGIHWSSRPELALTFALSAQVYILDQQHIWVETMDGSLHGSQDGGKSWNTLRSTGKPSLAEDMSFTDPNTGWIATSAAPAAPDGNVSQLFHTTDGGHTWQQIPYSIQ